MLAVPHGVFPFVTMFMRDDLKRSTFSFWGALNLRFEVWRRLQTDLMFEVEGSIESTLPNDKVVSSQRICSCLSYHFEVIYFCKIHIVAFMFFFFKCDAQTACSTSKPSSRATLARIVFVHHVMITETTFQSFVETFFESKVVYLCNHV